jgi:hypothetical protein
MAAFAERTELESQQLKFEASGRVWVACTEARRHGQEESIPLSPSLALRSSAAPALWSVQAPASLALPFVQRLASKCARNERHEVRVQLSRPRKAGSESTDPTQCGGRR